MGFPFEPVKIGRSESSSKVEASSLSFSVAPEEG